MILVDPPRGSNTDIPNVALAFADVPAQILDLNTQPAIHITMPNHRYSVQTRTLDWVSAHGAPRSITTQGINTLCCYRYVALADNLVVPMLPVPNYSRFSSYGIFHRHWTSGHWAYPLLTSMGCPFGCLFCAAYGQKWRARRKDHIGRELREVDAAYLQVVDDCFNFRTDHLLGVCSLLDGREWMCTNGLRADRLTVEQARAMSKSGCTTVAFGLEAADDRALKNWHKGETLLQIDKGVRIAKDWFPSVSVYIIKDLPGATTSTYQASLDWAAARGVYVHASRYQHPKHGRVFETLSTPLDSPASRVTSRLAVARQWGWRAWGRYVKMDAEKAWRRLTR